MANTYLSRTNVATPTNENKYTLSVWLKKNLNATSGYFITAGGGGGKECSIGFSSDKFVVQNYNGTGNDSFFVTNASYRDQNGWYHIVVNYDSDNATSNLRNRIFINGIELTNSNGDFASYDEVSSAYVGLINKASTTVWIGATTWNPGTLYFDGLMSHFHFCDGQSYDATAFGEYDANGVWKIKTSPSVTYGTNGFFILKDGNSVTDQSGNGNNFTVGGGTLTNTEDSPSNVFATWNSLFRKGTSTPAFSNGNLTSTFDDGGANEFALTTLGASSGKYYAEIKWTSATGTGATSTGILDMGYSGTADPNNAVTNTFAYFGNGNKNVSGSASSYGSSYTSGDIIGIAMDLDNNNLYFHKNGTYQNSGDPTSGATGTGAISTIAGVTYGFMTSDYNNKVCQLNTGNGYFGTTAVASAGTNASGIGIFEYDVPTGYTALSTKGLNL